jgi:hypothetical protein
MAGFMPATHTLRLAGVLMGGRDKPGHDGFSVFEIISFTPEPL